MYNVEIKNLYVNCVLSDEETTTVSGSILIWLVLTATGSVGTGSSYHKACHNCLAFKLTHWKFYHQMDPSKAQE